jgi:hypothetical protein
MYFWKGHHFREPEKNVPILHSYLVQAYLFCICVATLDQCFDYPRLNSQMVHPSENQHQMFIFRKLVSWPVFWPENGIVGGASGRVTHLSNNPDKFVYMQSLKVNRYNPTSTTTEAGARTLVSWLKTIILKYQLNEPSTPLKSFSSSLAVQIKYTHWVLQKKDGESVVSPCFSVTTGLAISVKSEEAILWLSTVSGYPLNRPSV